MDPDIGKILIIGAKSELAKQIAKKYASKGYGLYLCGRNMGVLKQFSADMSEDYGIRVELLELDISDFKTHSAFVESLDEIPIGVICAVGSYPNQIEAQVKTETLVNCTNVNYVGPASILCLISNKMKKIKKGFIVGISSISGGRGRKKNYIYGSAKCAFSNYLSGLRNELFSQNIHVSTIVLGFIRDNEKKGKIRRILSVSPELAAEKIFDAQQNNKNVVHIVWMWKYILIGIKLIPEFIYKRLDIR